MENIRYTDGHSKYLGWRGLELIRCFYSQQFFLELSFFILARNSCKRNRRAKMAWGQEGQDEGGQDGGEHDEGVTGITSHDNVPDHVTVIIRLILILIRSMINECCAKTNNPPGCLV